MRDTPNFSNEIGRDLTDHPTIIPKRITDKIQKPEKTDSDNTEPDKTEPKKTEPDKIKPDNTDSDSTEDKKAGRPKKPDNKKRRQIILTIGPETFDVLSGIPDYRRKLSHYIDENLEEVSEILENYIIK